MVINSSKFNFAEVMRDTVNKYHLMYIGEVYVTTTEVIQEVAKESVKKLKNTSPKGATGKYRRGWAWKVEKNFRKRYNAYAVVYGKTGTYQIAHLLEHGHAKRGGGRTRSIEHIKPVEEWAIDEAYDRIIDRLSQRY